MIRVVLTLGCFLMATGISCGQAALFQTDPGTSAGRFVDPPRSILQQLRIAESSIEQKRHGEAVAVLGELLQREGPVSEDELSGQDFFLDAGVNGVAVPRVNKTLLGEARRLLNEMPSDAIARYELIYGAQARKLLDEAASAHRWSDVAEVKRRFFHTEAGRDATQLLIHRAISEGRIVQAGRLAAALQNHPRLDAKTKDLAKALIATYEVQANNLAAAGTRSIRVRRSAASVDFRMYSGQQATVENAGGQMPLADPLYTVDTTGSSRQERALRESVEAMSAMGELPPPSWLPLRVGNHLLMRTTERLVGVDFVTGKRVWEYPWFKTSDDIESMEADLDGLPDEQSGQSILKQRVWNDLPYGRISSDGTRVYVLGDLAQMEVASFSPMMGLQGSRPAERGTNSLVALDLATEGKLVWQIGGDLPATAALSGAFFLGPPIPVDDAIYVMAELAGDITLLCLDSATGNERWRQQLLAIETGGIDSDPMRRVAGAAATFQDGLLICSTGAGAVVAVDIQDRSLVWGVAIERNDAINQNSSGRREVFMADKLMQRWWDSTPMVVGKTVYVTPIESDRIFALDLLTGEKRWKEFGRSIFSSRYLAGLHRGTIILVGSDNICGVDSLTGKKTWKTRGGWLDSGERICGLGMFGTIINPATNAPEAAYYVPTSSNRIISISLSDGSALAHRTLSFPVGNLIAADGQVISQAATLLSVAYGQVSLEPKVTAALEADPNNVEMMVRKAQLLIEQQRRSEALKWLEKARAREPDNIEVQQLSINAMLGALREDFVGNGHLLNVLDGLIDQPAQLAELIKLQIRAAIERDQPIDAVGRLIDLSTIATDPALAPPSSASESEASRYVSLDSWIGARVVEAIEIAAPEQQELISSTISKHLDKYSSASTAVMQRLVHHFGSQSGSERLIKNLLERYAANQQWLASERMLLATASTTPDHLERLAPWQALALASVYAAGGLKPDAAAALQIAMKDEAATKQAAMELGINLADLKTQSAGGGYLTTWEGEVSVQEPNDPIAGQIATTRRTSVGENKRVVGRSFAGWQLVSEDSSPVALRDPFGSVHPILVDGVNRTEETQRQATFSGGIMIAILRGELIAVNLFELKAGTDPVLWRRPWRTEGGGTGFKRQSTSTDFGDQLYRYVVSSGGTVQSEMQLGPIVGDTFYLLQGNELVAMDVITATQRWRNMETPRDGVVVCDGETVAIISPLSQTIVKYDCRDGKRIGEEPFTDYRLWAATDDSILVYRALAGGKRELVLQNPISGKTLLEHTYEGLSETSRVLGRIVDGTYAVTYSTAGETLIWDLENARVVSEAQAEPIPNLSGFHVLLRLDSLVLLPAIAEMPDDSGNVSITATHGDAHVRTDICVTAIDLNSGKVAWTCPLDKQSWGCTLTQSPVSPLVMLSRSKSKYLTTGSRTKSIDITAVDVRDGKALRTLEMPIESFANDIETRITVQPPQQRVRVNIGTRIMDYEFGERINPIKPRVTE